MKITDRLKRKEVEYRYVEVGEVFKVNDCYYLATTEFCDERGYCCNCANLDSGELSYFTEEDMVEVGKIIAETVKIS